MFKTRVTEMLGIEYPIIAGTLGYLSFSGLVSAVANAGGLCCLPSVYFDTKEALREEIRKTRSLTDKPFGVNINLFPTARPVSNDDYIDVCIEEGIKIIETSGRSPAPHIDKIKKAGITLMHKCARVRDAKSVERAGVDLVEIVGTECGGHPSMENVGTLILVPQAVDTVSIPVIGGGGFADARGFVACMALGAEGVLMGTRFMITKECLLHNNYRQAFMDAGETSTEIIQRSIGNPSRVLRTKLAEEVIEAEKQGADLEKLMPLIRGERSRAAMDIGDVDSSIIACGEVVGLIHNVPTVQEVFDSIIEGAKEIYKKLNPS